MRRQHVLRSDPVWARVHLRPLSLLRSSDLRKNVRPEAFVRNERDVVPGALHTPAVDATNGPSGHLGSAHPCDVEVPNQG